MGARPQPVAAPAHPPRPPIPIVAVDERARAAAAARLRDVAEPPGARGRLEELAVWLAGVTGDEHPQVRSRVVVAAADHDAAPSAPSLTAASLAALATGGATLTALARENATGVVLVDAGVRDAGRHDGVVHVGIAPGRDVAVEPALSVGEVAAAVDCGRDLAAAAARDGVTMLAGGVVRNGATTAATCLAAALTGADPAALVTAESGLESSALERERAAVAAAVGRHAAQARGPLGLLRRLGGGDVAVLCGLALGAGEHGLGYVCDGLAGTAAAAIAVAVEPALRPRLVAGHRSPEPGHAALLEHLRLDAVLDLAIGAGDGSGALAAIAVLRLAAAAL